ncbi:hypothetical protein [Streptomyces sp. TRM68367]|uniref:hypothetical protein n=1 Tax=Streptomyces sp. TRM68367 TaxID=2758415 RepID=UPI00165C53DB|nr:hypothetical protein [Streptomyces sp. TRM68367]MBC9729903.1 hypothetical protein [Streptomyces sp. TRM68367]
MNPVRSVLLGIACGSVAGALAAFMPVFAPWWWLVALIVGLFVAAADLLAGWLSPRT